MKKIKINVLKEDLDLEDTPTGAEEKKDDQLEPALKKALDFVIENCTEAARGSATTLTTIQECESNYSALASSGDVDMAGIDAFVRNTEKTDQANLSSSGDTIKSTRKHGNQGSPGQSSCIDDVMNNPYASLGYGLLAPVFVVWSYKSFFGPNAANRISATSNAAGYVWRSLKSFVNLSGVEKTPAAQRALKEIIKTRSKLANVNVKGKITAKNFGKVAGLTSLGVGGIAGYFFLAGRGEDGTREPSEDQAGQNIQSAAEFLAANEYTIKTKKAFKYMGTIDPEADYVWGDKCAITMLIAGTISMGLANKLFRRIKPGSYDTMKRGVKEAARIAAQETQSLVDAMLRYNDRFFDQKNLDNILAATPDDGLLATLNLPFVPARAGSRSGALGGSTIQAGTFKGKNALDTVNEAAKNLLTAGSDDAIAAARKELVDVLSNLTDRAQGEALAYLEEMQKAFINGQRTVLKTHSGVVGGRARILDKLSRVTGEGFNMMFARPFVWLVSKMKPGKADDVGELLDPGQALRGIDDAVPITKPSDLLDTPLAGVDSGMSNTLARATDDMTSALRVSDDEVRKIFYGMPFSKPSTFDDIFASLTKAREDIGDTILEQVVKEASEPIKKIIEKKALEYADEAGRAGMPKSQMEYIRYAEDVRDGRAIILTPASSEIITLTVDNLSEVVIQSANKARFKNSLFKAFDSYLDSWRSLRNSSAATKKFDKALKGYDNELGNIVNAERRGAEKISRGDDIGDLGGQYADWPRFTRSDALEGLGLTTGENISEMLSRLIGRPIKISDDYAESLTKVVDDLTAQTKKRARGEKGVGTNLSNLPPKVEGSLIALLVGGGIAALYFEALDQFNARMQTVQRGEGANRMTSKLSKQLPKNEDSFVSRQWFLWSRKVFVGQEAESRFIVAHVDIHNENTPRQNKALTQQNLEGIFYKNAGFINQVLRADLAKAKAKEKTEDSLYKLVMDIKNGKFTDERSIARAAADIKQRFCSIRRPSLERAAKKTISEYTSTSGRFRVGAKSEEEITQTQEEIEIGTKSVAITYIINNRQFQRQLEEMLKSGPRNLTPEEISDAFLYEPAMIDDVLNFIVNELGETNVVINGDPVKIAISKKQFEKEQIVGKINQLKQRQRNIAQGGEENINRRLEMSNIAAEIDDGCKLLRDLGFGDVADRVCGENVGKETQESINYSRHDLSKMVLESLKEYSYAKGYNPYPYHSDIGTDEEPADDYVQDWKDFELSLVRDQSRETAISLAKILVKDLELFGDVVDLVGKNQSIGTEILKKFKKKRIKSDKV